MQRAACLALGSLLADNRTVIKTLLSFRPPEIYDDLIGKCGGLGMLLVLVRDARPDAGTLQKAGGDSAWDEVRCKTLPSSPSSGNMRGCAGFGQRLPRI